MSLGQETTASAGAPTERSLMSREPVLPLLLVEPPLRCPVRDGASMRPLAASYRRDSFCGCFHAHGYSVAATRLQHGLSSALILLVLNDGVRIIYPLTTA